MKHIHVNPNNKWRFETVGFIGKFPEEFNEYFKISYEDQWESVAYNLINGWFEVLQWGQINLTENTLKNFFKVGNNE
jgi:hypothetical protein